jgi:hypothetical protein
MSSPWAATAGGRTPASPQRIAASVYVLSA